MFTKITRYKNAHGNHQKHSTAQLFFLFIRRKFTAKNGGISGTIIVAVELGERAELDEVKIFKARLIILNLALLISFFGRMI